MPTRGRMKTKLSQLPNVTWPEKKREEGIITYPDGSKVSTSHLEPIVFNQAIDQCDKTIELDEEKIADIIKYIKSLFSDIHVEGLAKAIASNIKEIIREVKDE